MSKLHRNLVAGVAQALKTIFAECKYTDKALEQLFFHNKQWGSRDRAFIAETTYDMVRYWRYICFCAETDYLQPLQNYFYLVGIWLTIQEKSLPDWQEWNKISPSKILLKKKQADEILAIRYAVPDWLFEIGSIELGKNWQTELEALNQTAKLVVRANTLKITTEELATYFHLTKIEVERLPNYPDAIIIQKRQNLFTLNAFRDGWFEMQDASSQLVARLLAPQSGMRVVDACAGAGGKTLHLAALMQNKGTIIALDTEGYKLKSLQQRARRAGVSIIETRLIDSSKVIKRLYNTADCLLLDVPCSGLGVLRRNPDSKWKLQPDFIENIRQTQQNILQQYTPILKSGGKLVYATCSILPSENEKQVHLFLASQAGKLFTLSQEVKVSPAQSGFDGFYMALLIKK